MTMQNVTTRLATKWQPVFSLSQRVSRRYFHLSGIACPIENILLPLITLYVIIISNYHPMNQATSSKCANAISLLDQRLSWKNNECYFFQKSKNCWNSKTCFLPIGPVSYSINLLLHSHLYPKYYVEMVVCGMFRLLLPHTDNMHYFYRNKYWQTYRNVLLLVVYEKYTNRYMRVG